MESLVFSFVSALTGPEYSDGDDRKIHVIVPRSHAYLADLLARAFEGRGNIEVIVDRRRDERRVERQPVAVERRREERRRRKEAMIEVVVDTPRP